MSINHALSVRSDFSIGESLLQTDHIIEEAQRHGYESVALVDTMSIHSLVDFTTKCKKAGIKPIVGCRLRVYDDPLWKKPAKNSGIEDKPNPHVCIKVYVAGERGITSLMKLLSAANSREQFYYHARTGWEQVFALEDVLVSTGDFNSLWHHQEADAILQRLIAKFSRERVYVELAPIDTPLFDTLNARALKAAHTHAARTLVTYPFLYRDDADAPTLEVLQTICSSGQYKMDTRHRPRQFVRDFGFKPAATLRLRLSGAVDRAEKWGNTGLSKHEIATLFARGLVNTQHLADACRWEFAKLPVSLPTMATNEFMELGRLCIAGWGRRFGRRVMGHQPSIADLPKYRERLNYELAVLKKMGFAGYFLLVADLVNWSKANGIIVGPGRGSVGGSLVAYLLGITEVDPIRFNLLFERFINPERLDLPDADLDFQTSRRHEVFQYLVGRHGADRVAGVSNFSTLASASALRDAGRVHELSNLELSPTKLVPKEQGVSATLEEAAKAIPEIDKFRLNHPHIWGHALKLEGVMRSFGQHAGGVVIGGVPLHERAVVETRSETDEGLPVVSWDKRTVEDWGLVKMDVLGLSTLDVLEIARQYIKGRHGVDVTYTDLPLEDPDVMDAFGRGDTTGVFQFESPGMRKLLRELRKGGPLTFEDITAATALYRPGPMDSGLMDDFVAIKQGMLTPSYEHPNMEAALESTYSVIVYQEQVMQLAIDLAGFSRAGADHLRKAMGKKDKVKMAEQRKAWVEGCEKHSGMDAAIAGALFDKIEAFAGYGFNRSHAVEYSIISYWTMWLRVRYPAEYFAACLSIVKEDKLAGLVKDAREAGIEILPPDINLSTERFTIPDDTHILAPFSAVKGLSDNTAHKLMAHRAAAGGRFTSAAHFEAVTSVKGSKITITHRERLKLVGALASIDPTEKPARHPDRRRDQTELMPGLIIDNVKADRTTDVTDKFVRAKVIHIVQEYRKCGDCDLAGRPHPQARMKSNVKFMVVADCPSWEEEKADKLLEGEAAGWVKEAIRDAGLQPGDGYYTTLVKAKKNDKFLSNDQINGCSQFLTRELEVIKPPVIVALGSAAIRRFIPGAKGAEMVGKTIYDAALAATIVCGLNPQQINFDPSKYDALKEVFKTVHEIVS